MPNIVELVATITGKIDGFRKAMVDGAAASDGFAASWSKAATDVSTAANRVGATIGAVTAGIVAYTAKMGVAFNTLKEDATADFKVLLGSAEKAGDMLGKIQTMAAKTPLESSDLMQAAKTMLNFGIAGERVIPLLKQIGDASGGNAQRFSQMALAFSQVNATGRLMGQDLLQLVNAGFNPLQEISSRTGESMGKLKERMEAGGISAKEVSDAFKSATSEGGRFFGMMDAKSATLSGQLSTLRDNFKIAAGSMFEPLSNGIKKVVESINRAMDSGQFAGTFQRLKDAVDDIVFSLTQLASSNGTSIVRAIADGLIFMAQAGAKVVTYLREQGPALANAAGGWLQMLQPIVMFLSKHPEILSALIALKITGMMGLNQAAVSLASALWSTISSLQGMATAASAATTATAATGTAATGTVTAFAALGPLGIAAVFIAIAAAATIAAGELSGVNKELREAEERRGKLKSQEDEDQARRKARDNAATAEIKDPGERKQRLIERRNEKTRLEKDNRTNADRMPDTVDPDSVAANAMNSLMPPGVTTFRKSNPAKETAIANANKAAADARQLQAEIDDITRQEQENKSRDEQKLRQDIFVQQEAKRKQEGTFIGPIQQDDPAVADRKNVDKFLAQHRNDGLNAQFPGYDKARDFLGVAQNGNDVQQFASSQKGVSDKLSKEFATLFEESDKTADSLDDLALRFASAVKAESDFAKRIDKSNDVVGNFNEKLADLQGAAKPEQIADFSKAFQNVQANFVAGKLTADQYRDSLKFIDDRMRDASQAGKATAGIHEDVTQQKKNLGEHSFGGNLAKGLSGQVATAAQNKFAAIEKESDRLAEAFNTGKISAAQFSMEMSRLKKATDDAADAAIREENQKRKEALARGDWQGAGLNFSSAVQDKVAQQQMGLFDQSVTDFVNQFFPLTQLVQTASDGFTSLTTGMDKFGKSMASGHGDGSGGGGDSQAQQIYANFINSIAGKIANAKNMIQFDKQALTIVTDPAERKQYLDAIDELTRQITSLNRQVSTFNGNRSYDPIFRDPGVQSTAGGNHTNNVSISMPNVLTLSQGEVDTFANTIANSLSRQGHPSFR